MRPHVATIAGTDKGATIEIMGPSVTTETMGHGLTRIETMGQGLIQGHTTTMTNKNIFDFSQGTLMRSVLRSPFEDALQDLKVAADRKRPVA
jgi:hypothetical protein